MCSRWLKPAVDRAAMDPDPFGERFNGPALFKVDFDHLFAVGRQIEAGTA